MMNAPRVSADSLAEIRPRFIADAMLGRLTKWLRLLGYDVAYEKQIEDKELIERARAEERVILTRDSHFLKRRLSGGIDLFIFENDRLPDQLRGVVRRYRLSTDRYRFSRCVECNLPLAEISRDTAAGRVPDYVYQHQDHFSECPGCHRIYWAGTHLDRIDTLVRCMFDPQEDSPHD